MDHRPAILKVAVLSMVVASAATAYSQLPRARGQELALSRSQWKLFVPNGYEPPADRNVNLLVHFHGDPQTIWNNAAYAELNAVIVTVNYSGLSSAYRIPFSDATLFQQLLDEARFTLGLQPGYGPQTRWDKLAVSSFSAGYGAVREMLKSPAYADAIDSLLAADSLYATTASDGTPLDSQMAGYKAFADRAAAGEKRFIFTHSQVPTFTYESTAETGDELLQHLRLIPETTRETGLGPLQYYRKAERNGFQLWGAEGADADGHLNHLRYLGEWLDDLGLSSVSLPGDYNGDGTVDAADYNVWRDAFGSTTDLAADGDGSGAIDQGDYLVWATSYASPAAVAVPEATAATIAIITTLGGTQRRAVRMSATPRAKSACRTRAA